MGPGYQPLGDASYGTGKVRQRFRAAFDRWRWGWQQHCLMLVTGTPPAPRSAWGVKLVSFHESIGRSDSPPAEGVLARVQISCPRMYRKDYLRRGAVISEFRWEVHRKSVVTGWYGIPLRVGSNLNTSCPRVPVRLRPHTGRGAVRRFL